MNRIDRLMAIVTTLQAKKYVTADQLSEKFSICVRTVYRDIKALGELGIPISFENQRGYCVVQGYFLPPVAFSMDETNALLLMESAALGFSDKSIRKHYSSALTKIKAVLRTKQKENIEFLSETIKMQVPERLNNDFEYLSVLQNAISSKTIIEIEYKNQKEETSKRHLEAIGLVFYAFSWHLIAWCHARQDYRDFKLSRIVYLNKTETPFKKTNHIKLNDYELPVSY